MRVVRDLSWVSLGAVAGTAACFALDTRVVEFAAINLASFASAGVFVMLLRSSRAPRFTPAAGT